MAAEQSEAIVLRIIPWSETSLIVNVYTREFGKLSAMAKGARRPKSPFEAALDLLSICRVVFIPKAGDTLSLLTEAKLQRRFRAGSRDLLRLYAGYYVAELLERLTDKGDRQPEIFDLAVATLQYLADDQLELRKVVLLWELQMLRLVGHLPSWRRCVRCGREVADSEWISFGVLDSGVLCETCQAGTRQVIRLATEARDILEEMSQTPWQETDLTKTLEQRHRRAVRGVLTRYLTVLLDRKLLMHSYLEELGR